MGLSTKPTLIEVKSMRFLIMDAPRQANLHVYIKEMRKYQVTSVARFCERTYQDAELKTAGIDVFDMEYKDGTSPSNDIITGWLSHVDDTFFKGSNDGKGCIAVHCVAGLGRAPVMVALALIEFAGMDAIEVVRMIRGKRRGAVNEKQLLYLESYKKQYKRNAGVSNESSCCVIL